MFSKPLTPEQKIRLSEFIFLFLLTIVSPLFSGLEIWGAWSFTFSLIFVNLLQIPSIILFYRVVLPRTLMQGKIWQFFIALPVYLIIYEINNRLATVITIHTPFIPQGYRNLLIPVNAQQLSWKFNQSLGYTCMVLLTTTSLALLRTLFKQQQEVFQVNLEKVKLELDHLKSQVQPHFFFNTLNNLYALSVQKSDKAPVIIASLSGIMRYVLYDSQHEQIALDKELNFIKDYVELERLRHTDPEVIDLSIQGETSTHEIEPLLFLPLIENCFKHALHKDIDNNAVKIIFMVDEDELTFQTVNSKGPMKPAATSGGIGLQNVRKRLELLYPDRYNLFINDAEDKFELVLTISLKE